VAPQSTQNLGNHVRYVPLYHFVLTALGLLSLGLAVARLVSGVSVASLLEFLLAVSLILTAFFARSFAVTAQDRVIRLEERLRMQALAPELAVRFNEFTTGQVTALRFASDAELPALAKQVLEGKLTKGIEIKKQIREWKRDHLRV
jgi:hypothetical protein